MSISSLVRARVQLAIIAACVLAPCAHAQRPHVRAPLFRYVKLIDGTITLGQPLGWAARFARAPHDTVVDIPPTAFGGADGIRVVRRRTGVIRRISFLYTADRNIAALIAEYRGSLGAPSDSTVVQSRAGRQTSWFWRDQQTEFRVVQLEPPSDGVVAMAEMSDRAK